MTEKLLSKDPTPSAGALAVGPEADAAGDDDAAGADAEGDEVGDGALPLHAATKKTPAKATATAFFRGLLARVLMEPMSFLGLRGCVAARRRGTGRADRGTCLNVRPRSTPRK
jgi:hypothetical protein